MKNIQRSSETCNLLLQKTLFLSWIGQHNPVTSAGWLKSIMSEASIDVGIFKSHSVRGATCSKAAGVLQQSKNYWKQQIGPMKEPFNGFITGKWTMMTELVLVATRVW